MISIAITLTIAAVIGYTAQVTGLCMVRGVSDWIRGRRLRLTAILMAGFWIYLFTPLIAYYNHSFLTVYAFHWSIPLGGFMFGIGAAINGACGAALCWLGMTAGAWRFWRFRWVLPAIGETGKPLGWSWSPLFF